MPVHLVSGDFDGNGIDDLAADFVSNGLWIRLNNNPWRKRLANGISNGLSVGDLDGNGSDELIWSSPNFGLFALFNNTSWVATGAMRATRIVTGDFDGNGQDDVVRELNAGSPFGPSVVGLYVRYNNIDPWVKFSNMTTQGLADRRSLP